MSATLESERRSLAPRGELRAAINVSNTLLVTGRDASGAPVGLAPAVARALAERLGVPLALKPFPTPGAIVDQANEDAWDVALIGAEHGRAGVIAFTPPYARIEATYLVQSSSGLNSVAEVDAKGVRIAAPARTAYGLWLEKHLAEATLVLADGLGAARDLFAKQQVDALAGLRPWLLADAAEMAGAVVLPGRFTEVAQAVGYRALTPEVAEFLDGFIEHAKRSGLISRLMAELGVRGVSVALD